MYAIQMNKLTPEQQVVADRWTRERAECNRIWNEAMAKLDRGEPVDWEVYSIQLRAVCPSYCEHGRSYASSCMACDEIEVILHPELFGEEDSQ